MMALTALRSRNDTYFATEEFYSPRLLDLLIGKVNTYRTYCETTGKTSSWQRKLKNYYGVSSDGSKSSQMVTRGGDAGQLTLAKVNDFRNLIQHQLILITAQRPAGQAKAVNSDTVSLHQARIASLLTEYYLSQVGWEQRFVAAAEAALVVDEAFHALEWDATAGDPIRPNPETGQMMTTGDSDLRVILPWNMARDPYLCSPQDMDWGIYSWRTNKFELALKYPNAERAIISGASSKIKELPFVKIQDRDTDQCEVFCLTHAPSPIVPQGRLTLFVADGLLLDVPSPYAEFNIYRISQNDILDTSFGYSNNSDLLAIEEITDALHSVVMSNQIAFGAQAIIGPKGSNLDHTQLAKGFAYFEVDAAHIDKIKPLALTHTTPEIFNYLEVLNRKKETLAGINSVVRGDPEGALRSNSGSALALVQAQSIQFNSGGQRSYYHLLSKVNTGHIKLLQQYADSERTIKIAGKVQSQYLKEFKYNKDTLQNVSTVVFEAVDAAFQTMGGKVAVAESLLEKGMIKNAHQYINVVRTGSLDILTEDDEGMQLAVKSENERLRDGEPVTVVATENHEEHIESHKAVIASPESKENQPLVQATLAHIQEHVNAWQQLSMENPALLIATGQKVLPPPPGMGPQPTPAGTEGQPPPGGPPGQAPPNEGPPNSNAQPGGGKPMPKVLDGKSPVETKAGQVQPPRMPMNPATKQRVQGPPMGPGQV